MPEKYIRFSGVNVLQQGQALSMWCACRVLQPGNPQLSGPVPLGTPYPVLRHNGASGYSMCSQFPCTREPSIALCSHYVGLLPCIDHHLERKREEWLSPVALLASGWTPYRLDLG